MRYSQKEKTCFILIIVILAVFMITLFLPETAAKEKPRDMKLEAYLDCIRRSPSTDHHANICADLAYREEVQ